MNTFGKYFRITSFGESHGVAYGAIIDGCPSRISFSQKTLKELLSRRKPGQFPWQSSRKEQDDFQILSGVYEDKTIGTPIAIIVMNQDARPKDYEEIKKHSRLGHADDLWKDKFNHADHRGGGRASGRETISRVMGGAVAKMFLHEIYKKLQVLVFTSQIGPICLDLKEVNLDQLWDQQLGLFPSKDQSKQAEKLLLTAKEQGESYGGIVQIKIKGVPRGLGQPVFSKLKSDLASALMGIGATFGMTIGTQWESASMSGEQFHKNNKHYGGIRGGISTGEMIEMQLAFKPPSSRGDIAKKGRHDPCIIPRAIPVIESMIYLVLADHVLAKRLDQL